MRAAIRRRTELFGPQREVGPLHRSVLDVESGHGGPAVAARFADPCHDVTVLLDLRQAVQVLKLIATLGTRSVLLVQVPVHREISRPDGGRFRWPLLRAHGALPASASPPSLSPDYRCSVRWASGSGCNEGAYDLQND
jgi:hypothetical protein